MIAAVVDTGPLVALLDDTDAHHAWAKASVDRMPMPLLTCEAVLTETLFLLSTEPEAPAKISALLKSHALQVAQFAEPDLLRILELMTDYEDVPMSLADACLVRLSELHPAAKVVTLDSDFLIYRRHRKQSIPLLIPKNR